MLFFTWLGRKVLLIGNSSNLWNYLAYYSIIGLLIGIFISIGKDLT